MALRPYRRHTCMGATADDQEPPHILVTTPESLFILMTAEKSRAMLRTTRTVIVDEIHAIADDKRGSHLALTLARLDALVQAAAALNLNELALGNCATDRSGRRLSIARRVDRRCRPPA